MSSDFVRYCPEIETIDPDLDELLPQIIEFWEKKVRESPKTEGTGRAVRGAHAKTFGVVKAEVEFLGDVPAPYAQGIYAEPGRHDALIRFSSAGNHLGPTRNSDPFWASRSRSSMSTEPSWSTTSRTSIDVRPRAQEQPDLHRQHGEALSGPPGDRQRRRELPRARQAGFPRALDRSAHRQGHVRAVRLGLGRDCSRS